MPELRSGSTTSEVLITRKEINRLVSDALEKATALFSEKLAAMDTRIKAEEFASAELRDQLNKQEQTSADLSERLKKSQVALKRLEQYSRRSYLRIHGLNLDKNASCKKSVNPSNNDADQEETTAKTKTQTNPIIARFHARDVRDDVISARRQLKGRGISIQENLTTANFRLLKSLNTDEHYESAWSWGGKINARHKKGYKAYRFDIFDA
ncbi:hypothetical protein CAPTEDRAFT_188929 [Capitella teleta]|uniref:Uncharacterized protein n=1 Tax=Capitella teleta TaxID=283909 RepID=R7U3W5_CAPTE|nr:hypothetical protein CAPTEDRAFT_188929 [Capitella teleta]|eukprot:ELU00821.1 hypothetical protein CAPTEDRAFT_188929 [Capitella teleta]